MRPQSGRKRARSSRRSARARSSSSKAEPAPPAAAAREVRRSARRLYTAGDVARALDRMAAELTPRLQGANPVVLAVMHGGAYAALELCKRFRFPHEFDYVHVTRYRGATRGGGLVWRVRPRRALAGRTVLVVDDILDAEADTTTLGKTAGKDADANKPTYVTILGLARAKELARELHERALEPLAAFGRDAQRLIQLAQFITQRSF